MERKEVEFVHTQRKGREELTDVEDRIVAKEKLLTSLRSTLQNYHQMRHRYHGVLR